MKLTEVNWAGESRETDAGWLDGLMAELGCSSTCRWTVEYPGVFGRGAVLRHGDRSVDLDVTAGDVRHRVVAAFSDLHPRPAREPEVWAILRGEG